jgi:hypothetical protein
VFLAHQVGDESPSTWRSPRSILVPRIALHDRKLAHALRTSA